MQAVIDTALNGNESTTVHKFEHAGLGKAPFRYVGMSEKVITYPDGTSQAAGTCDYCGTGIRYVFYVVSACGKQSGVGCDCIRKVADTALVKKISSDEAKIRKARNEKARIAKAKRDAEKMAQAVEKLAPRQHDLMNRPHPNAYLESQGKTLWDCVEFLRWSAKDKFIQFVRTFDE